MKRAARVLFLIAMIAIAIGALGTETSLGFSLKGIDKLVHLGAFFLLALLGALGWPRYRALFLIGLPVLGVAIEALQTLVPSREFSLLDAVMNGIGVGVGVTFATVLVNWAQPSQTARSDSHPDRGNRSK